MKRKSLILSALLLMLPALALPQTPGVTLENNFSGGIHRLAFSWVSSSSAASTTTGHYIGEIARVVFVPDSTSAPSDNYDVTILDSNGIDVLAGAGANLSSATASQKIPILTNGTDGNSGPVVIASPLVLSVSNAGHLKAGEVILYLKRSQ